MLDSDKIAPRILTAAIRCYAEENYRATSLSKIAASADTSKQVLLHHFSSKQRLYFDVLDAVRERLIGWLDDAESTSASTDELLESFTIKLLHPDRAEALLVAIRAASDPITIEFGVQNWALRPFFDRLRRLTIDENTRSSETEEKSFALMYGLLGSAGFVLASRGVLSSMYGGATLGNIERSMERELRHRIAWL